MITSITESLFCNILAKYALTAPLMAAKRMLVANPTQAGVVADAGMEAPGSEARLELKRMLKECWCATWLLFRKAMMHVCASEMEQLNIQTRKITMT